MDKVGAYQICKERGHEPSDRILTSNPPMNQCKFCGTAYRYESVIIELGAPKDERISD